MKKTQKLTTAAIAGSMALALAATGASAAPSAARPRVSSINLTSACSKGSLGNLQVQREDNGQLSIDVGVDMARHVAGVAWRYKVTDDGVVVASGTARTISDGSFSVSRVMWPKGATNHFVFTAKNLKTGEVCRLTGAV